MSITERKFRLLRRLADMGFTYEEAQQLRRIEMTLSRWSELECGDGNDYASWAIERDEVTDKPYMTRHVHTDNIVRRTRIADRERGALNRADKIMQAHPDYLFYHQGDPRGCSLYIIAKSDVVGDLDSCYTRGIAVCD